MIAKVLENFFRKLLPIERYAFRRICAQQGLQLDYRRNREGVNILDEIFVQKAYAPFFPFYESATIVDVGAHFGYFSLFAALNTDPGSRILALEPSPTNFQQLQQNLAANPQPTIQALQAGLSTHSGSQFLSGPTSFNQRLHPQASTETASTKVRVLSLADLMQEQSLQKIDFLKLDCEGAEYDILLHSPPEVLERIRVISMEFHDRRRDGYRPAQLIDCLELNGFAIERYTFSPNFGRQAVNFGQIVGRRK